MTTAYMPRMRAYVENVRSNDALEQSGWTFVNTPRSCYYELAGYRFDVTTGTLFKPGELRPFVTIWDREALARFGQWVRDTQPASQTNVLDVVSDI